MKMQMSKTLTGALCAGLISLGLASTAQALPLPSLESRLGGTAVYDPDLDITWLADANAGAGSSFDNGSSTTDGRMTWQNANDWAASLTVGGFTDWRLPTALNSDGSGPCVGLNCTGSEMGHLFYSELGGVAFTPIGATHNGSFNLFTNVQSNVYWSATEFAPNPSGAWGFRFDGGVQGTVGKDGNLFAWAVRSGDVAASAPEPATLVLLGLGLAGIGFGRRGKRRLC